MTYRAKAVVVAIIVSIPISYLLARLGEPQSAWLWGWVL